MTQVLDKGQVITSYTYDLNGNRESMIYSNGNNVAYTYNFANKVKTLTNYKDTTVISQETDNYYLNGKLSDKTETGNKVTEYNYDGLGRLTLEKTIKYGNTNSASYEYDDFSNRISKNTIGEGASSNTSQYDLCNRLIKEVDSVKGTTDYTYDNNGNMLTSSNGSDITSNIYNPFDQLTHVSKDGKSIGYSYDGDGLRTQKSVDGNITKFILDNQNVIAEISGSNITESYLWGINLVARKYNNGQQDYYLYNRHGDISGLSDEDGQVTKTYEYDAFGNEKNIEDNDTNSFRYSGEYFDKETGQIYLRARYYNPGIGRFINEDIVSGYEDDPLSLNLYTYGQDDPVNYSDPSGHGILDIGFIAYDTYQFLQHPSWANAGWLALDAVTLFDPTSISTAVVHASRAIHGTVELAKGAHAVQKLARGAEAVHNVSVGAKSQNIIQKSWKLLKSEDGAIKIKLSPAERASKKGFPGIGTTIIGGPDFAGTKYLYPVGNGQKNIVSIELTGGRGTDYTRAFNEAKIPSNLREGIKDKYVWHHVDDFNSLNGESTMQLIEKRAHKSTITHRGSCAQYAKFNGVKYK